MYLGPQLPIMRINFDSNRVLNSALLTQPAHGATSAAADFEHSRDALGQERRNLPFGC